jgi:predicted ATP-grasp superfamily ATP-dependent carboligase
LIERQLIDTGRLPTSGSLLRLAVDASVGTDVSPLVKPIDRAAAPCYLKRVLFAPINIRFEQNCFRALIDRNTSFHDLPANGTMIGRGQPVMTVIRKIDGRDERPMRDVRAMLGRLRRALRRLAV